MHAEAEDQPIIRVKHGKFSELSISEIASAGFQTL